MSVRFSTKVFLSIIQALGWMSPVTRQLHHLNPAAMFGGLMSESTVYTQCSVSRSTNFIYPSWSPHLTSTRIMAQWSDLAIKLKTSPATDQTEAVLKLRLWVSTLARPHSAAVTRGHHQCRGGSRHEYFELASLEFMFFL